MELKGTALASLRKHTFGSMPVSATPMIWWLVVDDKGSGGVGWGDGGRRSERI